MSFENHEDYPGKDTPCGCASCRAVPSKGTEPLDEALLDALEEAVVELPDRTSPDDWPEAMLITAPELRALVGEHVIAALRARLSEVEVERDNAPSKGTEPLSDEDVAIACWRAGCDEQDGLRRIEAIIKRHSAALKAGRITCRCGKDTASIKNALCYNCRNRPHWDLEAAEARTAQLEARVKALEVELESTRAALLTASGMAPDHARITAALASGQDTAHVCTYACAGNDCPRVVGPGQDTEGDDCSSCIENVPDAPRGECAKSKRPCGHHCNHSWEQESCCWCGQDTEGK